MREGEGERDRERERERERERLNHLHTTYSLRLLYKEQAEEEKCITICQLAIPPVPPLLLLTDTSTSSARTPS